MKSVEIPLVSPEGKRIVGFLTNSGVACAVTCSFSRAGGENYFSYQVPPGVLQELAGSDGARVFVDEGGAHWSEADVMWHSTPRGA